MFAWDEAYSLIPTIQIACSQSSRMNLQVLTIDFCLWNTQSASTNVNSITSFTGDLTCRNRFSSQISPQPESAWSHVERLPRYVIDSSMYTTYWPDGQWREINARLQVRPMPCWGPRTPLCNLPTPWHITRKGLILSYFFLKCFYSPTMYNLNKQILFKLLLDFKCAVS